MALMRALLMLFFLLLWKAGRNDTLMLNYSTNQQQQQICWNVRDVSPPPPQKGICHSVFFNPSITVFCISQPFILYTYFSGMIYQHIMLQLHISPLWSFCKCYSKSLIKNQPAKKERKKDRWTEANTLWLIFNLKGHEWTEYPEQQE